TAATHTSTLSLHDALPILERDHAALDHGVVREHSDEHDAGQQAQRDEPGPAAGKRGPAAGRTARLAGRAAGPAPRRLGCARDTRSEEHTSELQSRFDLVCR